MSITLHIERLVLDEALAMGRGAALRESLERELIRQLAAAGPNQAWQRIGAVSALPPAVCLPTDKHSDGLGSRVAAAVVKQLRTASSGGLAARRGVRYG